MFNDVKWAEAPKELLMSQLDHMAEVRGSKKGEDPTVISVGPFTGSYKDLHSIFDDFAQSKELEDFAINQN